jgi:oxygen-independent coproporphyrinogen-3 oxidase
MGLGASSLIENVRYANTRELYDYMYQCENLSEKPPEAFAAEGQYEEREQKETEKPRDAEPQVSAPSDTIELFAPEEKPSHREGWFGCNLHATAEIVDRRAQIEEFMFLGLRMNEGIARSDFERNFGVPIEAVYLETIKKLRDQGLLVMAEGRIRLTDRGMDLANYVMSKFLL